MFVIPFSVLITWPKPNYDAPERRPAILAWLPSAIFLTLSTSSIIARIWHRCRIRHWLGFDDLFVVLAWGFSIGITTVVSLGNQHWGWDRHLWDVRQDRFEPSLKGLYLIRLLWGLASCFVRFSVICLFYRLIKQLNAPRHFWWTMHVTTFCNIVILLYYVFTGIFPCVPIRAYWSWPPINAFCSNDGSAMQASGVLNTVAEAQLAVLPIIALRTRIINIERRQYWNILPVLSLGFLVTIVGCFRTFYIWRAITTYDLSWWSGPQWVCAEVELDLAIVCAGAAPLRAILGRLLRKWRTSTLNGRRLHSTPLDEKDHPVSTTSTALTISQIHHHADLENASEWAESMRVIDLEGIPDDGLGYTVTITGGLPAPGRAGIWRRNISRNLLHPRRTSPTPRRKDSFVLQSQSHFTSITTPTKLNIPMTVEVEIEQEARPAPLDRENRWQSFGSSKGLMTPGESIVNIDAALDGFEFQHYNLHLDCNDAPVPLGPGSGSGAGPAAATSEEAQAEMLVRHDGELFTIQHR